MTNHNKLSHQVNDLTEEEFEEAITQVAEMMRMDPQPDWDAMRKEIREASRRILEEARLRTAAKYVLLPRQRGRLFRSSELILTRSPQVEDLSEEEFERAITETREAMFGGPPLRDWDAMRKETHEASLRLLAEARERARRNPDWLKGGL